MKYIIGPQSLASVFVKPATLDTEIPALKTRGQHRYNGHYSRVEFLKDQCRDVQFVYFRVPQNQEHQSGLVNQPSIAFPCACAWAIALEQSTGSFEWQ